jgi:hypothetical protein
MGIRAISTPAYHQIFMRTASHQNQHAQIWRRVWVLVEILEQALGKLFNMDMCYFDAILYSISGLQFAVFHTRPELTWNIVTLVPHL